MVSKLTKIEAALGPLPQLLADNRGSPTAVARIVNKSVPGLMITETSIRRYRDSYAGFKAQVGGPAIYGSDKWLYNILKRNMELLKAEADLPAVPPTREPTPGTEDLALMLSDLHFGKRVELDGRVLFDLDTARGNLKRFIENAKHLAETYIRPTHKLGDLIIFLIGDIVDGEMVYETQAWNLEFPVREQIHVAAKTLMELIVWGSDNFDSVRVFCAYGNHGAGDDRAHKTSNWDLILFDMLDIASRSLENVTVQSSTEPFNNCVIRGHKFHIRHKIPSQLQTAAGRAKVGGWYERHKFDAVLTGHWHNCRRDNFNAIPVLYNGCLFGVDGYTEELSYNSRPEQWMFLISEKRPITLTWNVDLRE